MRYISIGISLATLSLLLLSTSSAAVWSALANVRPSLLVALFCLFLLNFLFAYVRFAILFRAAIPELSWTDLVGPFFVGQVAGSLPLGIFAQSVGRGALLAKYGVSAATVTFLGLVERAISLGSLALMALVGAVHLFGSVTLQSSISQTGPSLAWLLLGMVVCACTTAFFVREAIFDCLVHLRTELRAWHIFATFAMSVAAHFIMLVAFVLCLEALHHIDDLASAASVLTTVMLVSSLPISFSGWGIRELGAVHALGAIGVSPAHAIAFGLTIGGTGSLILLLSVTGAIAYGRPPSPGYTRTSGVKELKFESAFNLLLAIAVAIFIPFQIPVTFNGRVLVINIADIFSLIAFFIGISSASSIRDWSRYWFTPLIGMITTAIFVSLIVGLLYHGPTSWALANRGLGWLVIVSYFAIGTIAARVHRPNSVLIVLRTALLSTTTVAGIQVMLLAADLAQVSVPEGLRPILISGFQLNSNAYILSIIFGLIAWMTLLLSSGPQSLFYILLIPTILLCASFATISRFGLLLTFIVTIVGYLNFPNLRNPILVSGVLAVAFRLVTSFSPSTALADSVPQQMRISSLNEFFVRPSSDAERMDSVAAGIAQFVEAPIFGKGLGSFVSDRAARGLPDLVIHNVPVWILAEMGLVGFALISAAALGFALRFVRGRDNPVSRVGLIGLCAFSLGCLVHDLFYQRVFWFVLGIIVATIPLGNNSQRSAQ